MAHMDSWKPKPIHLLVHIDRVKSAGLHYFLSVIAVIPFTVKYFLSRSSGDVNRLPLTLTQEEINASIASANPASL
jgi:hypothetical protein